MAESNTPQVHFRDVLRVEEDNDVEVIVLSDDDRLEVIDAHDNDDDVEVIEVDGIYVYDDVKPDGADAVPDDSIVLFRQHKSR